MKIALIDSPADPVRLAFPSLFVKRPPMEGGDGVAKYEVTLIIKPGGANAKLVEAAIVDAAKEKWGDDWKEEYAEFADDQKGLRKGNLKKSADGSIYDGFEGNLYVVAKNAARPGLFARDGVTPVVEGDPDAPYAGCYANVEIKVWALARRGAKKRIVSDLLGMQKTRDGDAFGGSAPPSRPGTFAALSAADEDDLLG